MKSRQIGEADIIDVILGQADKDAASLVHDKLKSDNGLRDRFAFWREQIQAMERPEESSAAVGSEAFNRVIEKVRASAEDSSVSHTLPVFSRLSRPVCGVAALACTMLVVFALSLLIAESPITPQEASLSTAATSTRPVEVATSPVHSALAATPEQDRSLEDVVSGVYEDGVMKIRAGAYGGSLRLSKVMRVEALDGPVRIGEH